jgi:peroxiredoxin Q/BCP
VTGKGGQVVGISTDSVETQRKFKEKLKVPYPLLSDQGGKVAAQYGGKVPVVGVANRATFVIATDGTVKEVITGGDAIDPGGAITACPIHRKGA